MKRVLFATLVMFSLAVFATQAPFHKDVDDRFKTLENTTGVTFPQTDPKETAGYSYMRTIKVQYDAAVDGGTADTSYALGVTVPDDSIIIESNFRVTGTVVSSSDNTIAFTCESSGDIIAAIDMTDYATSSYRHGAITATPASSALLSDGCEIRAEIGSGTTGVTAGKIDLFLKVLSSDY